MTEGNPEQMLSTHKTKNEPMRNHELYNHLNSLQDKSFFPTFSNSLFLLVNYKAGITLCGNSVAAEPHEALHL